MKVLLIRRKNQRVSVSYVRMLFVVSQENSVFTLYLFKYGGFFMSDFYKSEFDYNTERLDGLEA